MQLTKPQIAFISVGGVALLFILLVLVGLIPGRKDFSEKITIEVWGTDEAKVWENTINQYKAEHRTTDVLYTQITSDYEETLINAFAAGTGPDVFMLDNNNFLKRRDLLASAPETLIDRPTYQALFVQAAETDMILDGVIYGAPLYIDTLALAYNRDLLDQRGVATPPTSWNQLDESVEKLFFTADERTISAAGLGSDSSSIINGPDILNLMTMQADIDLVDENDPTKVLIDNRSVINIVEKYISYADPSSDLFAWSSDKNSIEAFTSGELAMAFIYQRDLAEIEAAPEPLNYQVIPMIQSSSIARVDYPDYEGLAVYKRAEYQERLWEFVLFAASNERAVNRYLNTTERPPALRSLIPNYDNLATKGIFAKQALTARSWLQPGEKEMRDLLDDVVIGAKAGQSISTLLKEAETFLKKEYAKYIE